ncbi:Gfo/Idh/MocA family protein [Planctomicrobium sp. SH668]|uniref:Gfo/Idh/MocA family protein n=1 Tax=Planctomicrobium sp. SH668 TaxID=3448126 RepID=UPI003F5B3DA0
MPDFGLASLSRRDLLKTTGAVATTAALSNLVLPKAYASEDNNIDIALVGCGGRGSGAIADALSVNAGGPVKLKAMADVFDNRLSNSYNALNGQFEDKMDVAPERKFIGLEAYKEAMDCLKPGDVVVLTTPPAFRWVQFQYAIEKGLNVFMEKPVTVDGPTSRKMFELAEKASAKNLKVGVGLMCRHSRSRGELFKRIQDGEIGELNLLRAYRMHGPVGSAFVTPNPGDVSEVLYQIANFHGFLWASGGCYSDFYIHNIDECCWMKNDFPVKAQASGGRHYRGDYVDQNFDNYSVEYTFKDGAKLMFYGRTMSNVKQEFASYAHGSKGTAVISENGHFPAKARTYSDQNFTRSKLIWQYEGNEPNPYQTEWEDFYDAIRNDKPYNEVPRGVKASLVTSMGRMAAHTGQVITYDQILNEGQEFAPGLDTLKADGPAPVQATENGKYPVPAPGLKGELEY